MAYLRGDYYIWADGDDRLHVWAFDGRDHWEESGWAQDMSGQRQDGRKNAVGVSVPEAVLDTYVVMRFAELIESGGVAAAIDRAIAAAKGNFGCEALAARADKLKSAVAGME